MVTVVARLERSMNFPRILSLLLLATLAAAALPLTGAVEGQGSNCRILPIRAEVAIAGADLGANLWDYGDAPDNTNVPPMTTYYAPPGAPVGFFPTLEFTANTPYAPQPGARHRVVDIGWLGNRAAYPGMGPAMLSLADSPPSRERDADLLPDPDPTTNFVGATPDHDKFDDSLYPALLPTWAAGTLTFRVSTVPGITSWYANILIDWNYDGDWLDLDPMTGAPEWVTVDMPITLPALTSAAFTTPPFPTGSTPGNPWLRITLSDTPIAWSGLAPWDGVTPPGTFDSNGFQAFECGETEDYCGNLLRVFATRQAFADIPCKPHMM